MSDTIPPVPPQPPAPAPIVPIPPAKPKIIPKSAAKPPAPPRPKREPNTNVKMYRHAGTPDLTADHIAAVMASELPDDFKALLAGRISMRNHKIVKSDMHIFEDDQKLTGHFTILKIA